MVEFTLLSFGMCAALLHHPGLGPVQQFDDFIGIGQVKAEGKQCEMFFFGNSTEGKSISLHGHAVGVSKWDNGMVVEVDGQRFFVPKTEKL
jgi:hypothetical protein